MDLLVASCRSKLADSILSKLRRTFRRRMRRNLDYRLALNSLDTKSVFASTLIFMMPFAIKRAKVTPPVTRSDREFPSTVSSMESREVMTYEDFGRATRVLAQRICDSEFAPDIVLSIARGGFFLGAGLGYALGVKNAFMMSIEYYTGIDERLAMPIVLPPVPNKVDLSGAVVLVADDVADSGHTLKMVMDFCAGSVRDVRSVVLYEKPQSVIVPNYSWKKTDKWINFPWSVEGPVIRSEALSH